MQKENLTTEGLKKGFDRIKRQLTGDENIISIIKEDHEPLKELIKIMKDSEAEFDERKQAFMEFAPLLVTHAKAEEKALYEFMKTQPELKMFAFEGDTEHMMADQLCEEIERVELEDEISAKIKVLAEAVEHHIKEEENSVFPEVKKKVSDAKLVALTKIYVDTQAEIISEGQDDSPREAELTDDRLHS